MLNSLTMLIHESVQPRSDLNFRPWSKSDSVFDIFKYLLCGDHGLGRVLHGHGVEQRVTLVPL